MAPSGLEDLYRVHLKRTAELFGDAAQRPEPDEPRCGGVARDSDQLSRLPTRQGMHPTRGCAPAQPTLPLAAPLG
jgi:hypothetical protein